EFDNFGTHHGIVRRRADGKVEITHDWLAGTGEATIDSAFELQRYSGARTTYKVDVTRVAQLPDVAAIAARFAAPAANNGGRRGEAAERAGHGAWNDRRGVVRGGLRSAARTRAATARRRHSIWQRLAHGRECGYAAHDLSADHAGRSSSAGGTIHALDAAAG